MKENGSERNEGNLRKQYNHKKKMENENESISLKQNYLQNVNRSSF